MISVKSANWPVLWPRTIGHREKRVVPCGRLVKSSTTQPT